MRHKILLQHQSKFQLSDKQVNFMYFAKKINCFEIFLYYGEIFVKAFKGIHFDFYFHLFLF